MSNYNDTVVLLDGRLVPLNDFARVTAIWPDYQPGQEPNNYRAGPPPEVLNNQTATFDIDVNNAPMVVNVKSDLKMAINLEFIYGEAYDPKSVKRTIETGKVYAFSYIDEWGYIATAKGVCKAIERRVANSPRKSVVYTPSGAAESSTLEPINSIEDWVTFDCSKYMNGAIVAVEISRLRSVEFDLFATDEANDTILVKFNPTPTSTGKYDETYSCIIRNAKGIVYTRVLDRFGFIRIPNNLDTAIYSIELIRNDVSAIRLPVGYITADGSSIVLTRTSNIAVDMIMVGAASNLFVSMAPAFKHSSKVVIKNFEIYMTSNDISKKTKVYGEMPIASYGTNTTMIIKNLRPDSYRLSGDEYTGIFSFHDRYIDDNTGMLIEYDKSIFNIVSMANMSYFAIANINDILHSTIGYRIYDKAVYDTEGFDSTIDWIYQDQVVVDKFRLPIAISATEYVIIFSDSTYGWGYSITTSLKSTDGKSVWDIDDPVTFTPVYPEPAVEPVEITMSFIASDNVFLINSTVTLTNLSDGEDIVTAMTGSIDPVITVDLTGVAYSVRVVSSLNNCEYTGAFVVADLNLDDGNSINLTKVDSLTSTSVYVHTKYKNSNGDDVTEAIIGNDKTVRLINNDGAEMLGSDYYVTGTDVDGNYVVKLGDIPIGNYTLRNDSTLNDTAVSYIANFSAHANGSITAADGTLVDGFLILEEVVGPASEVTTPAE